MDKTPTNRDKNWQKEALWTDDKVQTIMQKLTLNERMQSPAERLQPFLKVQDSRPKGVSLKLGKVARCKAVRMEPEGDRREYPGASYLSSFPNQNFSGFLFGRVKIKEYGYTVAAVKATLEYLMPPMERSTLPRRIPCSNKIKEEAYERRLSVFCTTSKI